MSSYRLSRAILLSVIALGMTTAEAPQRRASAQGKLDARYVVTLSGLPIGRGGWVIEIGDDSFTATANGATAGLLRVFASGQGQSVSRGAISGGQLVPSTYASHIITDEKSDDVRMVLSGGAVKELAANPNDFDANLQLASILARRGQPAEARPLLERAVQVRPGSCQLLGPG